MSKIKNKKSLSIFKCALVTFVLLLACIQVLNFCLVDDERYQSRIMLHDFYNQDDVDTLFLGSSISYNSINPLIIDENSDTASFNMSSSSQKLNVSYLYLQEAIKEYDVNTVCLELNYGSQKLTNKLDMDTSNMNAVNYLKPSIHKYLFKYTSTTPSNMIRFVIPAKRFDYALLNPAKIISNVKMKLSDDYRNCSFSAISDEEQEYTGKGHVDFYDSIDEKQLFEEKSNEKLVLNNDYWIHNLKKIKELCDENEIRLIIYCAPMPTYSLLSAGNYDEYVDYLKNITKELNLEYYDFNLIKEEYFDDSMSLFHDTIHMSKNGSETFSKVFSLILNRDSKITDMFYDSFLEKMKSIDGKVYGVAYEKNSNNELECEIISNRDSSNFNVVYINGENLENRIDVSINNTFIIEDNNYGTFRISPSINEDFAQNEFTFCYSE